MVGSFSGRVSFHRELNAHHRMGEYRLSGARFWQLSASVEPHFPTADGFPDLSPIFCSITYSSCLIEKGVRLLLSTEMIL